MIFDERSDVSNQSSGLCSSRKDQHRLADAKKLLATCPRQGSGSGVSRRQNHRVMARLSNGPSGTTRMQRITPLEASVTDTSPCVAASIWCMPLQASAQPAGEHVACEHCRAAAIRSSRHWHASVARYQASLSVMAVSPAACDVLVWDGCEPLIRLLTTTDSGQATRVCAHLMTFSVGVWRVHVPAAAGTPDARIWSAENPCDVCMRSAGNQTGRLLRRMQAQRTHAGAHRQPAATPERFGHRPIDRPQADGPSVPKCGVLGLPDPAPLCRWSARCVGAAVARCRLIPPIPCSQAVCTLHHGRSISAFSTTHCCRFAISPLSRSVPVTAAGYAHVLTLNGFGSSRTARHMLPMGCHCVLRADHAGLLTNNAGAVRRGSS